MRCGGMTTRAGTETTLPSSGAGLAGERMAWYAPAVGFEIAGAHKMDHVFPAYR
jgi:hypothetical protein